MFVFLFFSDLKQYLNNQNRSAMTMACNMSECNVAKGIQFLSLALISRMKRNVDQLAASYIEFTKQIYIEQYPDILHTEFYLFSDCLAYVCQHDIYTPITAQQLKLASLYFSSEQISNLKNQYDLHQTLLNNYQRQVLETVDITFSEDITQIKFTHSEYIEAMNQNGISSLAPDVKFSFGIFTDQLDQFAEYSEDLYAKKEFISKTLDLIKEYIYASYFVLNVFAEYNHHEGISRLSILSENMLMNAEHIEMYDFEYLGSMISCESILSVNGAFWQTVRNNLSSYGIMLPIGDVQVGNPLLYQNTSVLDVTDIGIVVYLSILSHLINVRHLAQNLCTLVKKVSIEYQCKVPSAFLFDGIEIEDINSIDFKQAKGWIKSDRIEFIRNIIQLIDHCMNVKSKTPIFTRSLHDKFIQAANTGPYIKLDPSFIGNSIPQAQLPAGARPILETGFINLYVIVEDGIELNSIELNSYDLLVILNPNIVDLEAFISTILPGPDFIYDKAYMHSLDLQEYYLRQD